MQFSCLFYCAASTVKRPVTDTAHLQISTIKTTAQRIKSLYHAKISTEQKPKTQTKFTLKYA
jgi:hypothetical protein